MEFTTGSDPGSTRHSAVCEWLTEHGFDINVVPLDAKVVIDGADVEVEVYVREGGRVVGRSSQHAVLLNTPSDLVRGNA